MPFQPRAGATSLALAASLAFLGCTAPDPLTQLVVGVRFSLDVPAEANSLEVEVENPTGSTRMERTSLSRRDELHTVGLRYLRGPLGDVRVRVRASRDGATQVEADRTTSFVRHQSRLLTITLESACISVSCGEELTCERGVCVPSETSGESLPLFTGTFPDPGPSAPDAGMDGSVGSVDAISSTEDAGRCTNLDQIAAEPDCCPSSDPSVNRLCCTLGRACTQPDTGVYPRTDAFVDRCTCPRTGDRCVNGRCIGATCTDNGDCASSDYICTDGQCICDGDMCRSMCTSDGQCGDRICEMGTCIPR